MNALPRRKLGPTCPVCGYPRRVETAPCGHCGFDPALPPERQWGLLTVFGYGLCGFMAGAQVGLGLVLAGFHGPELQPPAVLATLGGGVAGAVLATSVGSRLVPAVRCAYEHLLLAGDGGGLALVVAALYGVVEPQTLGMVWVVAGAGVFALLRRYGYRRCTVAPERRGRRA